MSWWKQRSQLHSGDSHSDDVTPGSMVYSSLSPPRKSRGKKAAADDYPNCAADTNREGSYNGGGNGGGYSNGNGNGGDGAYGNGNRGVTLYGGGGHNNPPYGNVSDGYSCPPSWTPHDPAGRTPMYINTREVHVYGAPQNFDDDQRRRGGGGGGGFFGPALHAVGHFVDRRFGLDDRN